MFLFVDHLSVLSLFSEKPNPYFSKSYYKYENMHTVNVSMIQLFLISNVLFYSFRLSFITVLNKSILQKTGAISFLKRLTVPLKFIGYL